MVPLFRLQNSSKLNYFVKIILIDQTCKFHELWLNTELIFCDNQKAYEKSYWLFVEGTSFMLTANPSTKWHHTSPTLISVHPLNPFIMMSSDQFILIEQCLVLHTDHHGYHDLLVQPLISFALILDSWRGPGQIPDGNAPRLQPKLVPFSSSSTHNLLAVQW